MKHKMVIPIYNGEDLAVAERKSPRRWRRLLAGLAVDKILKVTEEIAVVQFLTTWQSQGRYEYELEAVYIDGRFQSMEYTGRTRCAA